MYVDSRLLKGGLIHHLTNNNYMTDSQKDVAIYTTPSCQYCKKTKAFFDEHGIEYTEHDVSEDQEKRQEMVEKSGQMGVPVTIVGEEIITGFDEEKLKQELELA